MESIFIEYTEGVEEINLEERVVRGGFRKDQATTIHNFTHNYKGVDCWKMGGGGAKRFGKYTPAMLF